MLYKSVTSLIVQRQQLLSSPLLTISFIRKFAISKRNEEALERIKKDIEESKKSLEWRKSMNDTNTWTSKLSLFGNDEQNSDFISMMQQPIDLRPSAIKNWWKDRKEFIERQMQQYIPERHEILGNDLATAHFIVYRGGAVKFQHKSNEWIRLDENDDYDLPTKYNPEWKLIGIRCDNMTLYYEGLENIKNLQNLKFISFINVKTFDDWCLDRISGAQNPLLEVLDLTGTSITYRGLSAVYRMDNLKVLVIDDKKISKEFELTCVLLEDSLPKLKIHSSKDIH